MPALGGPGCALASTAINWTLAVVGMLLMARLDVFRPFAIFSHFCWPVWRRQAAQLRLGIPMGLSYLIEVTSYTFMALFIARFGTTTLAGHQIAGNIGAVLYMTPLSIGIATSTLVAQALGAHRHEAARTLSRHGILMAVMIACCYGADRARAAAADHRRLHAERAGRGGGHAAGVDRRVLSRVRFAAGDHAFVLRAYKVAVVPTVIYAVALWGVGLGGGYLLGFDVVGAMPVWLTGARGFWFANMASLAIAGFGLLRCTCARSASGICRLIQGATGEGRRSAV